MILTLLALSLLLLSCGMQQNEGEDNMYPFYDGEDLEVIYHPRETSFTLWAPTAVNVRLNLYDAGEEGNQFLQTKMEKSEKGTWRKTVPGDQKGSFYTFQISMDGKEWQEETAGIWAKAVGINGKRAAIIDWNETNPEGWLLDKSPDLKHATDIIIYEMHHRDFSISPTSGVINRGKYLALTEKGTKSPQGLSTGIDHLKELGITHIHLLPSFDFASIDENRLADNRYNWGYEPRNYNVPEGSYSTNPYDPVVRIREFKEMVQALHRNGMRVVMDVVYNHTMFAPESNFELTVPGYFYRFNPDGSYAAGSACGNDVASEREMVRHYMIESLKFWVKEYHIDGFRFDLMGLHDIETMNQIAMELKKIDPSIYLYGEGWTAGETPLPLEQRALKAHATQMNDIAVFGDDLRDALRGSLSDDSGNGFISGNTAGLTETVKFGIVGGVYHPQIDYSQILYTPFPYVNQPTQLINYISCHDDLCLVDKLKLSVPAGTTEDELIRYVKLGQTIVLTSQGVPFIRAGEEIFQDKKGVHNSFNSPDSINQIDWEYKSRYKELFNYYRELISLRKSYPAFRMPTAEEIRHFLHFLDIEEEGVVGYMLDGHANGDDRKNILVVFNGNLQPASLTIPRGEWMVVCRDGRINSSGLEKLSGGEIIISSTSALIMVEN